MYNPAADLVTLDDIREAQKVINSSPHCVRTPLLQNVQHILEGRVNCKLTLKLENMQTTGSYKVRGILNHLHYLPDGYGTADHKLVTMSAGNYGKAFAFLTRQVSLQGVVLMPKTAPPNRAKVIQQLGCETELLPSSELQARVAELVASGMMLMHSFDDPRAIAGHGTLGLEIVEDFGIPDIVLCGCGGGAVMSGTAVAIKESPGGAACRVYGVEPEGACTMARSLKEGRPVGMEVKTVAAGLAPPYAGSNSFAHVKRYVDDILVVSDAEILEAVGVLYRAGLVVEPSAAAAFAALYQGRVPDTAGKSVVIVVTGGNMTPEELLDYSNRIQPI